jgi:hypothetical protein
MARALPCRSRLARVRRTHSRPEQLHAHAAWRPCSSILPQLHIAHSRLGSAPSGVQTLQIPSCRVGSERLQRALQPTSAPKRIHKPCLIQLILHQPPRAQSRQAGACPSLSKPRQPWSASASSDINPLPARRGGRSTTADTEIAFPALHRSDKHVQLHTHA